MRIGVVVVDVVRRLGSLVQLSAVKSAISPRSKSRVRECVFATRAARNGKHVFLTRTGARGLEITTRKAAEGTSAHVGACHLVFFALVLTHQRYEWPFLRLLTLK